MQIAYPTCMILRILSLFILMVFAGPLSAQPCSKYLNFDLPWIEPVILNTKVDHSGANIGNLAIWKTKSAVARPCSWCPNFSSIESAKNWLESSSMGDRTRSAAGLLKALSEKNMADHFYGLTFHYGQIYFVTQIPMGTSLSSILASSAPWNFNRAGNLKVSPNGQILPLHAKGMAKTFEFLNGYKGPLPFGFLGYSRPTDPSSITLLDFLNSLEWNLRSDGNIRLSFFNLEYLFSSRGEPRLPLVDTQEGDARTVGIGSLSIATMVILNVSPLDAWKELLKAKTINFLTFPGFVRLLHEEPSSDPLIVKLKIPSSDWDIPPLDNLVYGYQPNEFYDDEDYKFSNSSLLEEHFLKHGKEFGTKTSAEYLDLATRFLKGENISDLIGLKSQNRRVEYRRFSKEPFEYVILDPDSGIVVVIINGGVLRTFFVLDKKVSGMDVEKYLVDQAAREINESNK